MKGWKEKTVAMMVYDVRIDRRVLDTGRTLAKKGWQVTVIAAQGDDWGEDEQNYPELNIVRVRPSAAAPDLEAIPADFHRFLHFPWHAVGLDYVRGFCAEAMQHPAAVYVAHDFPQLIPALLAAKIFQSHFVYDAHELFPDQAFLEPSGLDRFYRDLEGWLIRYVDRALTVNRSCSELMAIRYHIEQPEILLNCPSLSLGQGVLPLEKSNVLRQEYKLPDSVKLLLYQGGFFKETRNLETLIEGFKLWGRDDVALVMMGPGEDARKYFERYAERLGLLNKRVFIRPPVNQSQLLRYTASADAGIIPYHFTELNSYYCTPNKLFEYIVAGLPILSSDLPELNRYVSGLGIGLNEDLSSPPSVAAAMERFFASDLEVFRQNALRAAPSLTWESQEEKVEALYEALATSPPRHISSPGGDGLLKGLLSILSENPRIEKRLGAQYISQRASGLEALHDARTVIEVHTKDIAYYGFFALLKEAAQRFQAYFFKGPFRA
jgi:glycosyltransferase involved in cell wall biosynthesis